MKRLRFSLTSEQLELLLAFETSKGLSHLAEMMARDPSVVSRNLQRIAEDSPVLKKVKGRWELTRLGLEINEQTRSYLTRQAELLAHAEKTQPAHPSQWLDHAVLLIINAQNGLLDLTQEGRNNSDAERNIAQILQHWRQKKRRVIHIKHVSDNPNSIFFKQAPGCEFLKPLSPETNETVIEKVHASAFAETVLEAMLGVENGAHIVLVGFTANECIDATARDSAAKGFTTVVVGDATATFDLRDPSGKLIKAERLHRMTLANINAFYAKVVNTDDIL